MRFYSRSVRAADYSVARSILEQSYRALLQLRVLDLDLLPGSGVGLGVFPEREEILVRGAGLGMSHCIAGTEATETPRRQLFG